MIHPSPAPQPRRPRPIRSRPRHDRLHSGKSVSSRACTSSSPASVAAVGSVAITASTSRSLRPGAKSPSAHDPCRARLRDRRPKPLQVPRRDVQAPPLAPPSSDYRREPAGVSTRIRVCARYHAPVNWPGLPPGGYGRRSPQRSVHWSRKLDLSEYPVGESGNGRTQTHGSPGPAMRRDADRP